MRTDKSLLLLAMQVITRIIIIPVMGLALSFYLFEQYAGINMSTMQIIYLASIIRLFIYTAVRTVKLDWRD